MATENLTNPGQPLAPGDSYRIDNANGTYWMRVVPPSGKKVAPPLRIITTYAFMLRLTVEERTILRSSTDPVVQDMVHMLNHAAYCDLDYSYLILQIQYAASIGIIDFERISELLRDGGPDEALI